MAQGVRAKITVRGYKKGKHCTTCGEWKLLAKFRRHKRSSGGRAPQCRGCYGVDNQRRKLWRKYRITPEEYDILLKTYEGKCAICGGANSDGRPIHVDHDHETGVIRGMLCFNCNAALGLMHENTDLLRRMIQYLEES